MSLRHPILGEELRKNNKSCYITWLQLCLLRIQQKNNQCMFYLISFRPMDITVTNDAQLNYDYHVVVFFCFCLMLYAVWILRH